MFSFVNGGGWSSVKITSLTWLKHQHAFEKFLLFMAIWRFAGGLDAVAGMVDNVFNMRLRKQFWTISSFDVIATLRFTYSIRQAEWAVQQCVRHHDSQQYLITLLLTRQVDKLWAYVFSFTIEPLVVAEYQVLTLFVYFYQNLWLYREWAHFREYVIPRRHWNSRQKSQFVSVVFFVIVICHKASPQ